MTLMEMFISRDVFQLITMLVIFLLMIYLLTKLGKGVEARYAAEKDKQVPAAAAAARTGNNDAVTAAITAAVNEYKKTNK